MYRAVRVFHKTNIFRPCRKEKTSRKIWVRLPRKTTKKRLWVGSVHVPSNDTREETARMVFELFNVVKKGSDTTYAMSDFNIQFHLVERGREQCRQAP